MKNRFYCTTKRGQVIVENETTYPDSHKLVANFFEPTPDGYVKAYTDEGLPFNELIPVPTQAELDKQAQDEQEAIVFAEWQADKVKAEEAALLAEFKAR